MWISLVFVIFILYPSIVFADAVDAFKVCVINGDSHAHNFKIHHAKEEHLLPGDISCFMNDSINSPHFNDRDTIEVRVDDRHDVSIYSVLGDIKKDDAQTRQYLLFRAALSFKSIVSTGISPSKVKRIGKAATGCYVDWNGQVNAASVASYAGCAVLKTAFGNILDFGEYVDRLSRGYPIEAVYDPENPFVRRYYVSALNHDESMQMLSADQNTFPKEFGEMYVQYPFTKRECVKSLHETGERTYTWKFVPNRKALHDKGGELNARKVDTFFSDIKGGISAIQYYIDDYMCGVTNYGEGLAFGSSGIDGIYLCYNPSKTAGTCTIPQRRFREPYLPFEDVGDITVKNDTALPARVYILNNDEKKVISQLDLDSGAYKTIKKDEIVKGLESPAGQINVFFDTTFKSPLLTQTKCLYAQPYDSSWAPTAIRLKYTFINDGSSTKVANPSYGPYQCQVVSASEGIYGRIRDTKCDANSFRNLTPKVLGYYANWAAYKNFTADHISCDVDEIIYAFAQIGDCSGPASNYASEDNPYIALAS